MKISKIKKWAKENSYTLLIISSLLLGLICGFILKSIFTIDPLVLTYIELPGKVLSRAYQLILVPLIISSLSTSVIMSKRGQNKGLIFWTFAWIALFLTFGSMFGAILTQIIRPGDRKLSADQVYNKSEVTSFNGQDINQMSSSPDEAIIDVVMNLMPDNIIRATLFTQYTALIPINPQNLSESYKKKEERNYSTNLLGLCIFSLALGIIICDLGEKTRNIRILLEETNEIIIEVIRRLLPVTHIGMFFWICVMAIRMESPGDKLSQLGWFLFTATIAFIVIWFILYPGIYFLIVRKNPFRMYINIMPAIFLALGSSSSAITLPMTMKCMEEKHQLSKQMSHYFLPLAMNMHMPGTATYYPMAIIFIAQMQGITITIPMIISLCIYSVLQSMAFPATPACTLVYFVATCAIVGIRNPFDVLIYIFPTDWIVGRVRTATNITGDCIIASILEKSYPFEVETNHQNDDQIDETIELKIES